MMNRKETVDDSSSPFFFHISYFSEVIEKIRTLEASFKACIDKKETLTKNLQEYEIKLERAKKLTSGLSDEKERWAIEVERLVTKEVYVPGNSIVSAGMIAYAGAFTSGTGSA